MTIKITLLSLVLFALNTQAQTKTELIIKSNIGIGTEYKSLEYSNTNSSGELLYSPGGGMGIELGLGFFPVKYIELYSTLGYQKHLAMQYSATSESTDMTSFSFSRKSIIFGANYNIKFSEKSNLGLKIGGGGSYNIPGNMSITELNINYGNVTFYPEFGYHLELGLFYELNKWTIIPSIRYRNLKYHYKNYDKTINDFTSETEKYLQFIDYIKHVNASGFDLSITLRRKIGSN